LQAIMVAPVMVGSQLLGVMGLQVFHRAQNWERNLVVQIELLAQTLVQAVSRTRQQGALAVANARARRIAEYIPDGLLLLSTKGVVSWVSPSFCAMSGLPASRILHQSASSFFHPSHRQAFEEQMARAIRRHDAQITVQFQSETGDWRWADVALALSAEPDSGVPNEIVVSVRDVHERHLREQNLVRQADLDPLTGLANRLAFEKAITMLADRDIEVMVAFCDIDNFKTINDHFGHDVGDTVLRRRHRGPVRRRRVRRGSDRRRQPRSFPPRSPPSRCDPGVGRGGHPDLAVGGCLRTRSRLRCGRHAAEGRSGHVQRQAEQQEQLGRGRLEPAPDLTREKHRVAR
jgi:PAS domain S-box-containing protein